MPWSELHSIGDITVRVSGTLTLPVRILRTTMLLDADNQEQRMRVISKARLKAFWEEPGHDDAEGPLRAWYTHVSSKSVSWHSWADVKRDFATASLVGNCVVFNIGGNKYRLLTRILYPSQKVFTLKVMTHADYDDENWKSECGCFESPPKAKKKQSKRRRR